MRWVWLTCVLVLGACDRGPTQPTSPTGPTPTHTQAPVAAEAIGQAPTTRVEPEIEPEPEPEPDTVEPPVADEEMPAEPAREATEIPESSDLGGECCRTCRKGKACGDTCVARDRECTVAPGCACDA
jgi:hypothetical protein